MCQWQQTILENFKNKIVSLNALIACYNLSRSEKFYEILLKYHQCYYIKFNVKKIIDAILYIFFLYSSLWKKEEGIYAKIYSTLLPFSLFSVLKIKIKGPTLIIMG